MESSGDASAPLPGRRRQGSLRRGRGAVLLWMASSSASALLTSYIGQRTTPLALSLLLPAHFIALFVVSRTLAILPGRFGRHDTRGWRSFWLGEWWSWKRLPRVGALFGAHSGPLGGVLGLQLALGVETLLPLAISLLVPLLASRQLGAFPSSTSPSSIAATFAPMLVGIALSSLSSTPMYLGVALMHQCAAAIGLLAVSAASADSQGGRIPAFQLLWHTSPIAAVAATVASAITLLVNQPLSHSLYPPPSFALFIILITTLSTISTFSFLRFTLETGANEDRLVHVSLAVVPRALLTMMLAHLARRNGGSRGSVELSFTLASGLVGWAWVSTGVGEEAEDDDEVEGSRGRRRSSTSRSSSITPLPRSPSLSSKTSAMHDACHSPRRPSLIALLPLLPFLYVLVHSIHPLSVPYLASTSISTYYANRIGLHLKAATPFTPPTMDLVFSYYNEDLLPFSEHIQAMRNLSVVQRHRARAIVYSKDEKEEFVTRAALEAIPGVDEVVVLPNFGREGGTYLTHILRHYGSAEASSTIADLTLFLQHHLAWHWVAGMRWDQVDSRTGFLALGPYTKTDCGLDLAGNGNFPRMRDIYSMFREDFCPPTLQLSSWAGQFLVSRHRILANSRSKYETLLALLQAPEHHWVHEEGAYFAYKGSVGPSNPFLGHALERSWPVIFNCTDPRIADECKDDAYNKEGCQCFDLGG